MRIRDLGHYDVLVVGGGPAGFSAAIAAARNGARTALVEKYAMAGGAMTVMGNGSVDEFINPHLSGNRMVIEGIAWEFVKRLHAMGYANVPDLNSDFGHDWQYSIKVNTVAAAKLLDDMLLEAGVSLYYLQPLVEVETEQENGLTRVTGAVISTKAGLGRLTADFFIDATGDGDLCVWAGNDYELGGADGALQPGTLRYYLNGSADAEGIKRGNAALAKKRAAGVLGDQDLLYNATFASILEADGDNRNHVELDSTDSDDRTRAEIDARRRLMLVSDTIRNADTGVSIDAIAAETAPRESRRILGDGYMTAKDYLAGTVAPDAVCYTYWYIDIHEIEDQEEASTRSVYLTDERTPSIPLSAMRPKSLSNVYVAGRCISGDRASNSAIRVKASCMAMGEAVGTAAALGIKASQNTTRALDVEFLRKTLSANGMIVPGIDSPAAFEL